MFFCCRKSGQISCFIHDLVSIEPTVSTVFLLGRKAYRKVLIYLDLSNVQCSGPVQRTRHDSSERVQTQTMGCTFTCHELSLCPNLEHIFCLSQFYCVLCQLFDNSGNKIDTILEIFEGLDHTRSQGALCQL